MRLPASFDSYGTAKSGVGISAMSVLRPDLMMKCVVPVIMAGIIAVSTTFGFFALPPHPSRDGMCQPPLLVSWTLCAPVSVLF